MKKYIIVQMMILIGMLTLTFGPFVRAEESEASNEACTTVDKRPPAPLPVPQNLTASYNAITGDVSLTWDIDVSVPFSGFRIRHGINGGPKTILSAEVPYIVGQTHYNHPWGETAPDGVLTTYCFVATTYN